MHSRWKRFWSSRDDEDIARSRTILSGRQGASFMSDYYERALRTDSYNEISTKVSALVAQFAERHTSSGSQSSIHGDGLLQPPQETVDALLEEKTAHESPDMMKMITNFFQNSYMASTLCISILRSIVETRDQCSRMDAILSGMPRSGEVLGVAYLHLVVQGLSEISDAENVFARGEAFEMLKNVHDRYTFLSSEVDNSKKVVQKKEKCRRLWKGGCIGIVVALMAGATVVAVLVKTHLMLSVGTAPLLMVVAAVARNRAQQDKGPLDISREVEGEGSEMSKHGMECRGNASSMLEKGASNMFNAEQTMVRAGNENFRKSVSENGNLGEEKLEGTALRAKVPDSELRFVEAGNSGEHRLATQDHKNAIFDGFEVSTPCQKVRPKSRFSGVSSGAQSTRSVVYMVNRRVAIKEEWQCCGITTLVRQSTKLDAISNASFLVSRMLDTLRCLMTGLQETVESNKRLVEFGLLHQQDTLCVLQVGKQLFRNQSPLLGQLAKLEEQVVFGIHLINKARFNVFQKFSSRLS